MRIILLLRADFQATSHILWLNIQIFVFTVYCNIGADLLLHIKLRKPFWRQFGRFVVFVR